MRVFRAEMLETFYYNNNIQKTLLYISMDTKFNFRRLWSHSGNTEVLWLHFTNKESFSLMILQLFFYVVLWIPFLYNISWYIVYSFIKL